MKTSDYLTQILLRLNQSQWLLDKKLCLTQENVLFARDDAVEYPVNGYEHKYRVCREDLVTAERFPEAFEAMLAGGPDWIHSNLIPMSDSRFLVTVIAGQKINNPRPSMNTSYEPNKLAEIISTGTLVTTN